MYFIYSLPSTSRSSDLGNAATEGEQVGLLYFCNFFAVPYLVFVRNLGTVCKGHIFTTIAI